MNRSQILIAILVLITGFICPAGQDPQFDYQFKNGAQGLRLNGNARIENGFLHLDGRNSYAVIPDSGSFHLTQKGITLCIIARFEPQSIPKPLDMFLSKGNEFIFAKNKKNYYLNFHNGNSWCATSIGGSVPAPGQWFCAIATLEYFQDPAQGENGYILSVYSNGELELQRKVYGVTAKPVPNEIQIGNGFGGGPWSFCGDIARVSIYDYAMNPEEVNRLFQTATEGKIRPRGVYPVAAELQEELTRLKNRAPLGLGKWLAEAFLQSLYAGLSAEKLPACLSHAATAGTEAEIIRRFNQVKCGYKILHTEKAALLAADGTGSGYSPVMGLYDRISGREIFGRRGFSWKIDLRNASSLEDSSPEFHWTSRITASGVQIQWKNNDFIIDGNLTLKDGRLESDLSVSGKNMASVTFPHYSFQKLNSGTDVMVYPFMSGLLLENPTEKQLIHGQEGVYPSGRVVMQFGAYYDQKSGIYYACEDGKAQTKEFSVKGRKGELNVQWTTAVPGTDQFRSCGKGVIELYRGQWYESGQIYRRFLEKEASWWIPDLPRKSSPDWFRNNTLWILGIPAEGHDSGLTNTRIMSDELKYLREYFGLPFGLHWYGWNDNKQQPNWPHFIPKDYVPEITRELKRNGIYVKPYIDSRLWSEKDGPGYKTDYMFKSHGYKYAVKSSNGKLSGENYSGRMFYVMCPYARGWQDWLVNLVEKLAGYGFSAVYHDQVCTGRPIPCYDRSHGHLPNDPQLWLNGYNRIFERIKRNTPELVHDSEENAEPYLKSLDGYVVWRWTDAGQVPLYQSIYAGRTQFTGRVFNHQRPGDLKSFFIKAAMQLVYAEQIGWFMEAELRMANQRRIFIKKLMYLRLALLPYFNEGRMLAPVRYHVPEPRQISQFGGVAVSSVDVPKVLASSWKKGNTVMTVFVNASGDTVELQPNLEGKKVFFCGENNSGSWKNGQKITISPYGMEIAVADDPAEAQRLTKAMKLISGFTDPGKNLLSISRSPVFRKFTAAKGMVWGPKDMSWLLGCHIRPIKNTNSSFIGGLEYYSLIVVGEIDFGSLNIQQLELSAAVESYLAGGTAEVVIQKPDLTDEVIGRIVLTSTGSWIPGHSFIIHLDRPLNGKHKLALRFSGKSCCNFGYLKLK